MKFLKGREPRGNVKEAEREAEMRMGKKNPKLESSTPKGHEEDLRLCPFVA